MHDFHFWLDGQRSTDYGINLQRPLTFEKPSRRVDIVSIPGRNGDLHKSQDAFESVPATAECFVLGDNAEEDMGRAVTWLLGTRGTRRLETPEDPGVFRLVNIYEGFKTDPRVNRLGAFSVSITARPERFLKAGERAISVANGGTLYNPGMASKPLLEVQGTGAGVVTVAGVAVELKDITGKMFIDCDIQNAYNDSGDQNGKIHTPGGFPTLPPGKSKVTWSGGVTAVKITPRWWSL